MTTLSQLMNLKGQKALITGAAGQLGTIFAQALAEMGASLVLVDKEPAKLSLLSDSLQQVFGASCTCRICDLEQESARQELINNFTQNKEELNILVNNAALVGSSELVGWSVPFVDQSLASWRRALEVNLTAAFHLSQGFASTLADANNANIINISSIYAHVGPDWKLYQGTSIVNPAAYSASKAALEQLTRWLATSLAPNIRVNAIAPGGVSRGQPQRFIESYSAKTPLRRMAQPIDVKGAMAYLASYLSSYVTGQTILVDGGYTIS